MTGIHAFVDESGNTDLDIEKQDVSRLFIVTAVFVAAEQLEAVRAGAETVRRTFFQTGEMKSSGIGGNDGRRTKILSALNKLNFTTYSLAIDKTRIAGAGLRYKRSFIKYVNRRLFDRAFRMHENLSVTADEHGSEKFMGGFIAYVDEKLPRTLFNRAHLGFRNSREEVMLQVADLVAGTLARALDPDRPKESAKEFLGLLGKNEVAFDLWPPISIATPEALLDGVGEPDHDRVVRRHCARQAALFLQEKAADESEDAQLQLAVLEILLSQLQFGAEKKYVPSGQILNRLEAERGVRFTPRKLRGAVSGLRDAGVIIANSAKGYKIPVSQADVAHFVAHANSIVPPMLARVTRARDDLRAASEGEIDILEGSHFSLLSDLVEASNRGGLA